MQLEFHELDRRWEHLRVREPHRQRRLLASLADIGQQTPIVVIVLPEDLSGYLVIDGYKRIAALEQLGRDTVDATVWAMNEAEAVLLSRSLRLGPPESALEQGWLLAEMERRFGYSLDELGRRFDRSASWVSRRGSRPCARSRVRSGNWRGWRHESERRWKANMLSQTQRTAILELNAQNVSKREIARVLRVSRLTVRKVRRENSSSVPEIARAEKAEPYRQQILELLATCRGNLVRVHEELKESGAELSYPALTGFCRRQGIGQTPVVPARGSITSSRVNNRKLPIISLIVSTP